MACSNRLVSLQDQPVFSERDYATYPREGSDPSLREIGILQQELPLCTNVPLFGLSVPFPSEESEHKLEIEQYSGEALFSDASQDSNRSLGRFRFWAATVAVHPLGPQ